MALAFNDTVCDNFKSDTTGQYEEFENAVQVCYYLFIVFFFEV